MVRVKAPALRGKTKEELLKQLEEQKTELSNLQVQKVTGGATNKLSKIKDVRKSIARCRTVLRANQRENLRKFYKTKKYMPLDLRPKKTRAIRRALTANESSLRTLRQRKVDTHFSQRVYAVKA
eukprot:sb/3475711/